MVLQGARRAPIVEGEGRRGRSCSSLSIPSGNSMETHQLVTMSSSMCARWTATRSKYLGWSTTSALPSSNSQKPKISKSNMTFSSRRTRRQLLSFWPSTMNTTGLRGNSTGERSNTNSSTSKSKIYVLRSMLRRETTRNAGIKSRN